MIKLLQMIVSSLTHRMCKIWAILQQVYFFLFPQELFEFSSAVGKKSKLDSAGFVYLWRNSKLKIWCLKMKMSVSTFSCSVSQQFQKHCKVGLPWKQAFSDMTYPLQSYLQIASMHNIQVWPWPHRDRFQIVWLVRFPAGLCFAWRLSSAKQNGNVFNHQDSSTDLGD